MEAFLIGWLIAKVSEHYIEMAREQENEQGAQEADGSAA